MFFIGVFIKFKFECFDGVCLYVFFLFVKLFFKIIVYIIFFVFRKLSCVFFCKLFINEFWYVLICVCLVVVVVVKYCVMDVFKFIWFDFLKLLYELFGIVWWFFVIGCGYNDNCFFFW